MRTCLLLLPTLLLLVACGQSREDQTASPAPTASGEAATSQSFQRRFNDYQVQQSKLLPQLMQADELSPEARERVQGQTTEVLDGLRQLAADPSLTRAERKRTQNEITNLERMLAMYLPAG
jgi:hypothetical protein